MSLNCPQFVPCRLSTILDELGWYQHEIAVTNPVAVTILYGSPIFGLIGGVLLAWVSGRDWG